MVVALRLHNEAGILVSGVQISASAILSAQLMSLLAELLAGLSSLHDFLAHLTYSIDVPC